MDIKVIGLEETPSPRELTQGLSSDAGAFLQAKMDEYDLLPRARYGSSHIYEIVGYGQIAGSADLWQVKRVDIEGDTRIYPYSHDLTLEYFGRGQASAMEK